MRMMCRWQKAPLPADEADLLRAASGKVLLLRLKGPLSFGAANGLVRRISAIGGYEILLLDFSDLTMIDSSGSLAIEQIIGQAQSNGRQVLICGLQDRVRTILDQMQVLRGFDRDGIIADRMARRET